MGLTAKQQRFVHEYLLEPNALRAAIKAGYSEATAQNNAYRLMEHDGVKRAIQAARDAEAAKYTATRERIIQELGYIAFQRANAVYRPDGTLKAPAEWDEATAATISSVETDEEFRLGDAVREDEPQPHGGSLKRERSPVAAVLTRKVKRYDKVRALELFMRHFGMLTEDAPHPDSMKFDLKQVPISDDVKRAIAAGFRLGLRAQPG